MKKKILEAVTVSLSVAYLGITGYLVADYLHNGGWEEIRAASLKQRNSNGEGVRAATKNAAGHVNYYGGWMGRIPMFHPPAGHYPYYAPYQSF